MSFKKIIKKTQKRIRRVPDRFIWWIKIKKILKNREYQNYIQKENIENTWENAYYRHLLHHSHQNKLVTKDFLKKILSNDNFDKILKNAKNIVEIGCGTGEFSYYLNKKYHNKKIVGLEISNLAIIFAKNLYSNDNIKFYKINKDENLKNYGNFDLAICSNVLEHFSNPHSMIERIFNISPLILILVPYNQPVIDKYEGEGEGGHVFKFDINSFKNYEVIANIIFETAGWDYSSNGEEPKQIAIIIRKKL